MFNFTLLTYLFFIFTASLEGLSLKCGSSCLIYPQELKRVVQAITHLPEGKNLINKATSYQPINIRSFPTNDFEAFWNSANGTIAINSGTHKTDGSYIISILFELHNAISDHKFDHITMLAMRGDISKEKYVEEIEKIEFENAIRTCSLIDKGIKANLFPQDAYWEIFTNFDDHYCVQQLTGHAQRIAEEYDEMHPRLRSLRYLGTLDEFQPLSAEEKGDIMRWLYIKNRLASSDQKKVAQATIDVEQEYERLIQHAHRGKLRKKSSRKLELMNKILKLDFVRFWDEHGDCGKITA